MEADRRLLHLDVVKLHADTVRGIEEWAAQMERDRNVYVRPHLAELAKAQPMEVEIPASPPVTVISPGNRLIAPGALETSIPACVVVTRYVTS